MSKIIYFTNALDQNSFVNYLKGWKVSPNLSNQNFHHKLIKALSLKFDVEVVSVRAINSNYEESKLDQEVIQEPHIKWNYPEVSTSKVSKLLLLNKRINKLSKPIIPTYRYKVLSEIEWKNSKISKICPYGTYHL